MTDDLFEREDDVRVWMREFAAIPINGNPLPDAQQLWWKAELLKRWDAQRQAVVPIEQAEPFHITIGVTGAVVLLAWLWRSVPNPNNTLIFATILSLAMLVAVAALTLQTPLLKVLLRLRSLSTSTRNIVALVGLLLVGATCAISAQQPGGTSQRASAAIAFVNVNLIPMDRERVLPGQTVVVRGDRIIAIGPTPDVAVPTGATVVDGAGRYLMPGLTDAHVHLPAGMPWAPTRPDFGDAPLYLAYGVTTVVNVGGTPTQLEWRRRIESGELIGPTIYTSGQFINEPLVKTPDEVRREIVAQAHQGYDLIKFHERRDTTTGLSLPAYSMMNETAREVGLPLVGHAPVNLGFDALLQAHQSLAHVGALSNIYFLPLASNLKFLLVTGAALLVLIVTMATWGTAAIIARWRTAGPRRSPALSRVVALSGWVLLINLLAFVCLILLMPGGLLFDNIIVRPVFTLLALLLAIASIALVVQTARIWREVNVSVLSRVQVSLVSAAAVALACAFAIFWVPVSWRSSDSGIERVAKSLHDAGISVQSTLVVYETLSTSDRLRLIRDPAIDYLDPAARDQWRRLPQAGLPVYRYPAFMKKVTGALHRAGVPLIAGTDAMGLPLIVPGASLQRELALLTESGLTPYEALRAATVAPAVFLRKEKEFGTVALGKRADILLVEGNPLQNLDTLKRPIGVMARGRWLTREHLQQLLAALAKKG